MRQPAHEVKEQTEAAPQRHQHTTARGDTKSSTTTTSRRPATTTRSQRASPSTLSASLYARGWGSATFPGSRPTPHKECWRTRRVPSLGMWLDDTPERWAKGVATPTSTGGKPHYSCAPTPRAGACAPPSTSPWALATPSLSAARTQRLTSSTTTAEYRAPSTELTPQRHGNTRHDTTTTAPPTSTTTTPCNE